MEKILRLPVVLENVGLKRTALHEAVKEGRFPKPVSLTGRAKGWLASEVDNWIEERKKARETEHQQIAA